MGAEPHLVVVNGEVGQAVPKLEQLLPGIAVALVLLHGVVNRLLGEAVLQLEGGDGQAVDEQAQVQRQLRVVCAVPELAGDAEAVLAVEDLGLHIPRRGCAIEQVNGMRPVLDSLAQHVNSAALGDFPLQPGQEPAPVRAIFVQVQRGCRLGLGFAQKSGKLSQVNTVFPVIVLWVSVYPARPVVRRALLNPALWAGLRVKPVSAAQMRLSSPFSLVSVVTLSL